MNHRDDTNAARHLQADMSLKQVLQGSVKDLTIIASYSPGGVSSRMAASRVRKGERYADLITMTGARLKAARESMGVSQPELIRLAKLDKSLAWLSDMVAVNREKDDPVIRARDTAIITLFLGTGLRANELRMMRIGDIDWANRRITIQNAKGEGVMQRRVRISPRAYQALREWLRARNKYRVTTDYVWISQRRQQMTYQAVWHVVRRLGEYAGVEGAYPHQLRHTAATELYRETKDIMLVKQFLGHSKVATTERYLKRLGVDMEQEDYRTPDEWLT